MPWPSSKVNSEYRVLECEPGALQAGCVHLKEAGDAESVLQEHVGQVAARVAFEHAGDRVAVGVARPPEDVRVFEFLQTLQSRAFRVLGGRFGETTRKFLKDFGQKGSGHQRQRPTSTACPQGLPASTGTL